jgi:hypothetical protein
LYAEKMARFGNGPTEVNVMSQYELWLVPTDEKQNPLDPEILRAALEAGSIFFLYTGSSLCESGTDTIAQPAVEAVLEAAQSPPVGNNREYLLSTFARKVNGFLDQQPKNVPLDPSSPGSLMQTINSASDRSIERHLSILEIIVCMDDETRRVANLRFRGHSMTEIAGRLHVTPKCLSARYARGIGRAIVKARTEARKRSTTRES